MVEHFVIFILFCDAKSFLKCLCFCFRHIFYLILTTRLRLDDKKACDNMTIFVITISLKFVCVLFLYFNNNLNITYSFVEAYPRGPTVTGEEKFPENQP